MTLRQEITDLRTRYASLPANSHERPAVLAELQEAVRRSLRCEVEAARTPFVIVDQWPVESASPAFSWLGRIKRALGHGAGI